MWKREWTPWLIQASLPWLLMLAVLVVDARGAGRSQAPQDRALEVSAPGCYLKPGACPLFPQRELYLKRPFQVIWFNFLGGPVITVVPPPVTLPAAPATIPPAAPGPPSPGNHGGGPPANPG